MNYVYWFNVFEAILWTVLGILSLINAFRILLRWRPLVAMALLFFLFAGSEVIETQTGAWWNPWWLAVWKGLCIAGLLTLGLDHYRWQKAASSDAASDEKMAS